MARMPSMLLTLLALAASSHSRALSFLHERATSIPLPISFTASQNWEGIDGQWNTFALRVGTAPQVVRVMASTVSQETFVIDPRACLYEANKDDCAKARGGLFYRNTSSTWAEQGLYVTWIEQNLNYTGNAIFGYDSVGLGYAGEGGPTLKHQIVGAEAAEDFWFGHFGLHPKSTNFTDFTQNVPSYMSNLKAQNLIPSVSWGYTAGASYRFAKVPASLTLGGYDANKFISNSVTFDLAADNDRDILVYISSITANSTSTSASLSLLPTPIYSFIDSTVAEIWLPLDACRKFEEAFGLTFDPSTQLYFVSDTQHQALQSANPNITFTLQPAPAVSSSVGITFPYAAFDLTAKPPYRGIDTQRRYFPLRRAVNDTQYTLGRTFLQEAYLIVDWERQNFSVSQNSWVPNAPHKIVPIFSTNSSINGASLIQKEAKTSVSTGSIIGIAFGVLLLLFVIGVLSYLLWRSNKRRKHREEEESMAKKKIDDGDTKDEPGHVIPKVELDAGEESTLMAFEKDSYYKPQVEIPPVEAPENAIFELPGDLPPEAHGRELTEKEATRVREQRYNGVEETARGHSPISPLTPGAESRLSRRHTDGTTNLSPVSPQDGKTLASSKLRSKKKRIKAGDVQPVEAGSSSLLKPFRRGAKATPGEHLESSDGWSQSAEPSLENPSNRRRFSFER